jgi:uncharacterized protein (TIGR02594 family)
MQSSVASLVALAAVIVTVSPVAATPLTGSERFVSATPSEESTGSIAPAKRVIPVRQIEPVQRSDNAALLMPQAGDQSLRSVKSNTAISTSSLGKITSSSVSKMVLNSVGKTASDGPAAKAGDGNPLLEALRWKGATAPQVGVPNELWCADFMNFILGKTGHGTTGSRAARSFLKYGKQVDGPRVGAIVVFTRGSSGDSGHVGIVRGTDGDGNPIVISGNHGNKVSESIYSKNRVLGYFMPPNVNSVSTATLNAVMARQQ